MRLQIDGSSDLTKTALLGCMLGYIDYFIFNPFKHLDHYAVKDCTVYDNTVNVIWIDTFN